MTLRRTRDKQLTRDDRRRADVESFYHLPQESVAGTSCQGMACFAARHLNARRWQQAASQTPRVYCLGKCYAAPASSADDERPKIYVRSREAIVLDRLVRGGARTLKEYESRGGYDSLQLALRQSPDDVIRAVEASGLRGRGGAGFPTGIKWRAVSSQASERFIVANGDEGDPGSYIDRFIMEDDPHCLIEALAIAGYAINARKAYVYIRAEYPDALKSVEAAIGEARGAGVLSANDRRPKRNSAFHFDIEVAVGRGSYVCGEETALLNSIEGKRPEVRVRPPYPTERGLFGRPTLVDNVETLATVPWIVKHGGDAYRAIGFSRSRGTKVLSLNSLFNRPGLYELEFGKTLREIVFDMGGGLKTGDVKGVIVGGPLAGIIPPSLLDTPLGFEEMHAIGASVGHGGVVAFDSNTSIAELMHHVFSFGSYESCGKCTPCRLGTSEVERMFRDCLRGTGVKRDRRGALDGLIDALELTSLCGHGSGLAEFARSVMRYYPEELSTCFA